MDRQTTTEISWMAALATATAIHITACQEDTTEQVAKPAVEGVAPTRVPAATPVVQGFDVSYAQGRVDWDGVAGAEMDFVYIKKSEGLTIHDPRFQDNWQGAKRARLRRGAYHVFIPRDDVSQQVASFLHGVTFEAGDLPPALDLESKVLGDAAGHGVNRQEVIARAKDWLKLVQARTGRVPIVYVGHAGVKGFFGEHNPFAGHPLWLAEYPQGATGEGSPPGFPAAWSPRRALAAGVGSPAWR